MLNSEPIIIKKYVEKAVFIGVLKQGDEEARVNEYLDELEFLAETAGVEGHGRFVQKVDKADPRTYIRSGKLEEIKTFIEENEIDVAIFDDELSPTQLRNIERELNIKILDRTNLILDIFAQRAKTAYAKTQVELAQYQYLLPRLTRMWTHLERQKGGIGMRGPGETQIETDRRIIQDKIARLKEQLKKIDKQMASQRGNRGSLVRIALVGYTNVGKSTLMNMLAKSDVFAENKLFATLDTTSRSPELPDGRRVLLVDTVGLIRRLPHHLVDAFKSTLEEAASADIIIHIIDASADDAAEQADVTRKLLAELGCEDIPQINVLNKCDKLPGSANFACDETTVRISAKEKQGFDDLLDCIAANLPQTSKRMRLLIPYNKTSLIGNIRTEGKIFSEEYLPEGTLIDALVDNKILYMFEGYEAGQQSNIC